ncbi:hypothetical protein NEHOM01_2395 [Nematocida homosporus]|uniref:uncharacterized protein n=1 Tax=Nematocida homosporus TaxID=1912981 RepID=UPI00221FDD25|nr:uncharacterized protein NEHOM01_2395 [Nematocida homosporus]KAI5187831.1 hypothetical protein NEHOM01_2395 [Nematocida homosporus]
MFISSKCALQGLKQRRFVFIVICAIIVFGGQGYWCSNPERRRPAGGDIVDIIVDKTIDKVAESPTDDMIDRLVDRGVDGIVDRVAESLTNDVIDRLVDRVVDKVLDKMEWKGEGEGKQSTIQ